MSRINHPTTAVADAVTFGVGVDTTAVVGTAVYAAVAFVIVVCFCY